MRHINNALRTLNKNHLCGCPCFSCYPIKVGQVWEVLPQSLWLSHGRTAIIISIDRENLCVSWGSRSTTHNIMNHLNNMRLVSEANSSKESG